MDKKTKKKQKGTVKEALRIQSEWLYLSEREGILRCFYEYLRESGREAQLWEEAGVLEKREWETEEGSWKKYYINDRLEKIQETYEEMGIRDFNFSYQLAGKILEWRIPAQEEGNAPQQ